LWVGVGAAFWWIVALVGSCCHLVRVSTAVAPVCWGVVVWNVWVGGGVGLAHCWVLRDRACLGFSVGRICCELSSCVVGVGVGGGVSLVVF